MISQRVTLSNQDVRQVSATQLHKLGTIVEDNTGRTFRYTQAGAVNLANGLATISPARVANHTNIAVAVATGVNARSVTVTIGATAATQDQYKHGYLVVNDGPGVGLAYSIVGNAAIVSGQTGTVTLEEPIQIALTTASKVTLTPNPWSASTVFPGTNANLFCSGDTDTAVAAGSYYWSQTSGMTSTLSDGVIAKGVGAQLTTNAVVGAITSEGAGTVVQRVATAVEATVDTKYYPVYLTLE